MRRLFDFTVPIHRGADVVKVRDAIEALVECSGVDVTRTDIKIVDQHADFFVRNMSLVVVTCYTGDPDEQTPS